MKPDEAVGEDDVFDRVGIAPAALKRWNEEIKAFAMQAEQVHLGNVDQYPRDQAFVQPDGTLLLRLRFATGDELSMKVGAAEWLWPRRTTN